MTAAATLLGRVLSGAVPAFALLHRTTDTTGVVDVLAGPASGELSEPGTLDRIALPDPDGPARHDVLALLPYRQIAERGYACTDDATPLLTMPVAEQEVHPVADVLSAIADEPIDLRGGGFAVDDDGYADIVRRVLADEIGAGEGANFVIRRDYVTEIVGYSLSSALTLFRRLLQSEVGAHWTFLVHTGDRVLVGATPERHVTVGDGTAVMNPISGTYRYPASGPSLPGLMEFLGDRKEVDELFMVVDEELKMMGRICERGGRVVGPFLKEMARLAHTEYFIEGSTDRDPREILRETMFAPTVTGSPLESACRAIARHEPTGRGYYSGVVALIGRDGAGRHALDSSILIRTADIDAGGHLRLGVGSTLVRHSDPASEVAETQAKASAMLAALAGGPRRFAEHPDVRGALEDRNRGLAGFWLSGDDERPAPEPSLSGRSVLIVDGEDAFTSMLDHQLRSMGLRVDMVRYDAPRRFADHDLVLMGPGPGDPNDADDPRIRCLRAAVDELLAARAPFLAVCLSHQMLSRHLGLPVRRRDTPNQGVAREISLFGRDERVGFYNAFSARCADDKFDPPGIGTVEVCRDRDTGEVHALRGPHFSSMQFHAESVLTRDGVRIIGTRMRELLGA